MHPLAGRRSLTLFALIAAIASCTPAGDGAAGGASDTAAPVAVTTTPLPPDTSTLGGTSGATTAATTDARVEVDIAARKLHWLRGSDRVESFDVAVGSEKWPTQKGEWKITQVVFNPDWVPPDESWAEEREPKESGDPDNPLGRVQLVYDPPRTIHGTNQPSSIGKAVSHGSIRLRNADAEKLARQVMDAAGAGKDDAWFTRTKETRREKQIVSLPTPVPIRVY
jgi:lipoprotein-anchoring transpeptidase ErfK/SrfK